MAALAYQVAALDGDTWIITYQDDAVVNFSTGSGTDEITMTYEIGTGKAPTATLWSGDCTDLADGTAGTAIDVAGLATADVTDITTGVDGNGDANLALDKLVLTIDIDKIKIDGSNIWDTSTSKLAFCVELTLVESVSGEVVTQDLQSLDIDFDFDVSFDKTGDGADVDTAIFAATQDSEAIAATDTANVDDYISACKCDGTNCNTNALANDEILQVCVKSSLGATVAIQRVKTLDLTQTGTAVFNVMNTDLGGTVGNAALSTVVDNVSNTVVDTVVPARFFDTSNTIEVSGVVEVDFDGGRRLVAFGNNRLGSNDRKMIEAPFEDADLPQETTDAKFNFDVPVEKASTEDQFIDMNSGSTIGAAAGALAAVAVSYLW